MNNNRLNIKGLLQGRAVKIKDSGENVLRTRVAHELWRADVSVSIKFRI